MIDKKQLLNIARLSGLRPWQQEKHYVQSLILNSMSEEPIVFKGGTYLWFFHGLRRFSEDLDFTASEEITHDLSKRVSRDLALLGVENSVKIIGDKDNSLSFRISARGPLNTSPKDECFVYVEVSRREGIVNRTLPIRLDLPQYSMPVKNIRGMGLEEAGAEKVRATLTRHKARDIYDLYHLVTVKKIGFDRPLIDEKLSYYKVPFQRESFLKEIADREQYYSKELESIVLDELPRYADVLEAIGKWATTNA